LSRVYFILDERGEHRVEESVFPLSVGGSQQCDVMVPGLSSEAVLAHIALADGHAYIQAVAHAPPLFHNHRRLSESQWLKSGDRIQIDNSVIEWTVKGDQAFIHARPCSAAETLTPPSEPVPAMPSLAELPADSRQRSSSRRYRALRWAVAGMFTVLVLAAAFVLVATPVSLRISPQPATQVFSGFPPAIPVGDRLLALPGRYTVRATLAGYRPLEEIVQISMGGFQELAFELQEMPGRVRVGVTPQVPFRLFVDDVAVATDSDGIADIDRGTHRLRVETERYLPDNHEVDIIGLGKAQNVSFSLQPAWAEVHVSSQPAGAEVRVDGELVGNTPLTTDVLRGERTIILALDKHKSVTLQQTVEAGSVLRLDGIELPPADGQLKLDSEPAGATVSVDGTFYGTTPLVVTLPSATEHLVQLTKPGYRLTRQSITLAPDEQQELQVSLPAEYGVVFLTSRPADASLLIDGEPAGKATQRLRLSTRPHTLEVRKPGYASQRVTVTPRAGVSQNLDLALKTVVQARTENMAGTVTTAAGQRLRLVRPEGIFQMGASRREAGRRANESQRRVQLTRPFYLAEKEVSNAEFRRFRPSHNSGNAEGVNLNDDEQPVVNVSWDDAARYCNWLSQKEGLPPAYREQGEQVTLITPLTEGYRLPSEAEWAYAARVAGRNSPARYPWTGDYPPAMASGNFADARIADTLADVVPGYDDRFRGTAPVGSFPPGPGGFFDLGGNVAEWINDFYTVYPGEAGQTVIDPVGPAAGEHHVVRDSSWRFGSITALRLSYRDYSRAARDDLGFRIARYAQ